LENGKCDDRQREKVLLQRLDEKDELIEELMQKLNEQK
jgi:hypothetical protein